MSLVSEKRGKRVLGRFISLSIILVITFNSAGKIQNPLSASSKTVTPSISREKGETTAEYYSKNEDITKGTTYYNNNPEVKVVGVDVQTKGIEGTVKSLDVISVQDKVDSKNTGYNISYGIGIGDHTVVRDGKGMNANGIYTANIGVGYSRGDVTQRTTNAVGSFTAESGVLNVEGKTRQVGSVIGGNFTLKTKEYEHEDLEDINKSRTIGFNITVTPGVTEVYRNGRPTGEYKGGAAYGTRINYAENDYVAKVKATIGENVSPIIDGKLSELKDVNRDVDNRVEVIKDKEIRPINADLGTEYWATDYAREKARGDFVKAGNKIDRVAEILNAAIKNDNKDIYLYYKDRIAAEEEIARMEREGIDLSIIDKEQAKKIIERAAGGEVDDVQIISSKDPNIKEIIGAEGIRGRAYYTGKGKVVIVADNVEDYAKAIGVIGKEGRHFYHRGNGMGDTEDYSTFYGRQLEKYYRKHFGDADATFVTEQLKYTKEQLGKDWENDIWVSYNPLKINHVSIYNDKIDRLFSYGEPVPYVKKVYKKKWLLRDFSVGRAENDALQISTLENYLKDARRKKDDVVMFRLNLSDKALARVEKRLEKVTKGFYKFDCPSGEAGCQRKGEYYLMVKTDFLPNKFQQYSLLRNNCAVFVKRMLFNDVIGSGMNFSLGTVGNLPSNVADWAYNRTSTILDRNRKVTRSNKIIYYDYNNTGKKIEIDIKNKTVEDVYLEIQRLR